MIKQYDTPEYRRSERRYSTVSNLAHKSFVFRISVFLFDESLVHTEEHSSVYAAYEQFGNYVEHFTRNK